MSLRRAIDSGKEKRKAYRKSEAFDRSCRCHGGCPYCLGNRMHRDAKRKASADEQIKEHNDEREARS